MRYITAAIAMASGFIVLLGYMYPIDLLVQVRAMLTDWAVILAAMAALVGIANLIFVQRD
jgi:adenosine/AMP kinase